MESNSTSTLSAQDLTRVTGPAIAGAILNWYLYGALTVQYILYLMYSRGDKTVLKLIVHIIFLLDSVQTFFTMSDTFFYFVYGFGNVPKLFKFQLPFDVPTLDAVIALFVQGVYYWRIWHMSGWRVIPIVSSFISLMAGAGGIAVGIQFKRTGKAASGLLSEWPSILWLLSSAVADIIIACSMTYILLRWRRETSAVRSTTGSRIMRLLALTLETNAITAAVAIMACITFFIPSIAPPKTNFYQLGGFLLGKLYSNCFMVLLNQRYHDTNARTGSTVDAYQPNSQGGQTISGFNADTNTRSGATSTLDLRPVRVPLRQKSSGLASGEDFEGSIPLPEIKYEESRYVYKGSPNV